MGVAGLLDRMRVMGEHRKRVKMSRRPEWRGEVVREGFCEKVYFGDGRLGLQIDGNWYDAIMTDFTNPATPNCEQSRVRFKTWMHVRPPSDFRDGGAEFRAQIVETLRGAHP